MAGGSACIEIVLWWPSFAHLRQELACPGLKRRCHIARVAPDSRDGTRASREMRITRAKGVRYVILREFHVSEQSHVDSRAFLRIKNLNRDARKLVHTRDNKTATRVCHITRHVKYENLRRGLPGRPNDTQVRRSARPWHLDF